MARHMLFASGLAEKNRVEAFSDGVLAIVITLLVLELKVPQHIGGGDAALWHALAERLPAVGAWAVSFAFVLVFWVAHHYLFEQLKQINRGLLWLNGLFLLFVSLTPFPTALAGEYPASVPAVFTLSLAMFMTSSSFTAMRWFILRHPDLLGDARAVTAAGVALRRSMVAPALYLAAMVAAFVWIPLSIAIQIVVPALFFVPTASQPQKTAHS